MLHSKIIGIVGGGAAGMMAAYFAKLNNPQAEVILFEKNKYLGAKVIISGGGRCNVTTGILEIKDVLKNYPRGADFLKKAIYDFPPESVINWFESQGVALKTEEDLRVFPISNNGKDVVGALEKALRELGVKVLLQFSVAEIREVDDVKDALNPLDNERRFVLTSQDLSRKFYLDQLILTTGGNAYRHTGSTGDGYSFAQNLGHKITPLAPSLSSFILSESWIADLAGISFKKINLKFYKSNSVGEKASLSADKANLIAERTGPILFTHKGITGPAVFALSAMIAFENFENSTLKLDFLPEFSAEDFEEKLKKDFENHGNKLLKNILAFYLPHALADQILMLLNMQFLNLKAAEVSKNVRREVVRAVKGLDLKVVGRGAGDEFVTAGGVDLNEVDAKTMESKINPGLYFAGEILDIDGFTGGFNLQASWATGSLAGESAGIKSLV